MYSGTRLFFWPSTEYIDLRVRVPAEYLGLRVRVLKKWYSSCTRVLYLSTPLVCSLWWAEVGPWGRPWPRGHILKSLALASKVKSLALKPQVLENCPVLGSRTALFFEPLKFHWKTLENLQKFCEQLFCFPLLEHRRTQGGQGARSPPTEILPMTKMCQKAYCFFSFCFLLAFFADNSN